jgi:hypothetical protein
MAVIMNESIGSRPPPIAAFRRLNLEEIIRLSD